jgi:hypothetical protein
MNIKKSEVTKIDGCYFSMARFALAIVSWLVLETLKCVFFMAAQASDGRRTPDWIECEMVCQAFRHQARGSDLAVKAKRLTDFLEERYIESLTGAAKKVDQTGGVHVRNR